MQYNITYRQKDGGWQYIISYKDSQGKWRQKSKQGFPLNKKGKQSAKDAALAALEKLNQDIDLKTPDEFLGITFKQFGDSYLDHSKLYRAVKTVESTETVLNRFSTLNNIEMSKITTLDIQRAIDAFTKEGLNPNTIKYYVKKLSIIFNSAKYQYNIITDNPTRNLKFNKSTENKKKALTETELTNLISSFSKSKYSTLIFLASNTGMRLGELLGLTWKDIDLKNNYITVNKQWKKLPTGEFGFGTLKSKNSERSIPISQSVSSELLKYRNITNIDNRVFSFKSTKIVDASINQHIKRHGFNVSLHELRHTYSSKLIANGLDFKTTANILGHDVQQTIKTYSHVNNDMFNKAKKLIENIF